MDCNQVCSVCQSEYATSFCVCAQTPVLLCHGHANTHEAEVASDPSKAQSPFHFLLPTEGLKFVDSANLPEVKSRLTRLRNSHNTLRSTLNHQFDLCQKEINTKLEDSPKKTKMLEALDKLKIVLKIEAEEAISETSSKAHLPDYHSESYLADLVWNLRNFEVEPIFKFKVQAEPLKVTFRTSIPKLRKFNYKKIDEYEKIKTLKRQVNQLTQQLSQAHAQLAQTPTTQQMNQAISQQLSQAQAQLAQTPTTQQMNQAISQQVQGVRRAAAVLPQLNPLLTQVQPWNPNVSHCWGRAADNGCNSGFDDTSARLQALQRTCDNHSQLLRTILPLI